MEKTLITISRQFGSGGREIAELLTKKLHCHHFNSKIVEMAAADLHDRITLLRKRRGISINTRASSAWSRITACMWNRPKSS